MNALFDIWYGMSRRGRVFCWCAGVLCLTLTVTLSVGYPGWKTLDTQQTRLSQQREAARQQWRHLRRLSVAAEPLFGRTVENPRPFSPLDFQAPPLRLLHWQPSAQGGRNGAENVLGCGAVAVCPVSRKRDERQSVFIA